MLQSGLTGSIVRSAFASGSRSITASILAQRAAQEKFLSRLYPRRAGWMLQSHFFELKQAKGGYAEELDAYFDEVWARSAPTSREL